MVNFFQSLGIDLNSNGPEVKQAIETELAWLNAFHARNQEKVPFLALAAQSLKMKAGSLVSEEKTPKTEGYRRLNKKDLLHCLKKTHELLELYEQGKSILKDSLAAYCKLAFCKWDYTYPPEQRARGVTMIAIGAGIAVLIGLTTGLSVGLPFGIVYGCAFAVATALGAIGLVTVRAKTIVTPIFASEVREVHKALGVETRSDYGRLLENVGPI